MKRRIITLAAAAWLAGCVSQGPFPSLAVRPAELEDWSEEPVRTAPAVADDAALRTRILGQLAEARAGWRDFEADLAAAERAAAQAGAAGSDSWIAAQEAQSRLEAARSRTEQAIEELQALRRARAEMPTSPADRAALDTAIAEAEAVAARQQQRIDRLAR
ncbi:MAG: hypothetical protein QOJ53_1984 [Sphingomonadales bacterium]|jgi:hypothetical protein|nr:hypothetical protein [Sphingomonadales bacterium]MEA3047652.1 hypothetical protein [Sphingomonadales bacterium]